MATKNDQSKTTYPTNTTNYGTTTSGGSGSAGTLTGSAYGYDSATGGKADVADPTSSALSAITGSTSNLAALYNLAGSYDTQSAQQAVQQQDILTPGYSGNMSKWASDISDLLSGKISDSTKYSLGQSAAERGVSTGTAGSQSNDSAWLRALGLTSESLQKQGASELASMISSSPKAQQLDMSGYLTTPGDVQAAQQYANTVASAANPSAASAAADAAAKSGVNTGLSAAGSTPSTGGGSSIASLLSSILGTGAGGSGTGGGNASTKAWWDTGNDWFTNPGGNSIQDVVNGITSTGTSGYNDVPANPYDENTAPGMSEEEYNLSTNYD